MQRPDGVIPEIIVQKARIDQMAELAFTDHELAAERIA